MNSNGLIDQILAVAKPVKLANAASLHDAAAVAEIATASSVAYRQIGGSLSTNEPR